MSGLHLRRAIVALALFVPAVTAFGKDQTLFIELEPRSLALPSAVTNNGSVIVGNFNEGGAFYWMPTTGVIANGGWLGLDVSVVSRTPPSGCAPLNGDCLGGSRTAWPATSASVPHWAPVAMGKWWWATHSKTVDQRMRFAGRNRQAWSISAQPSPARAPAPRPYQETAK
jgi:hypothetical protein